MLAHCGGCIHKQLAGLGRSSALGSRLFCRNGGGRVVVFVDKVQVKGQEQQVDRNNVQDLKRTGFHDGYDFTGPNILRNPRI